MAVNGYKRGNKKGNKLFDKKMGLGIIPAIVGARCIVPLPLTFGGRCYDQPQKNLC